MASRRNTCAFPEPHLADRSENLALDERNTRSRGGVFYDPPFGWLFCSGVESNPQLDGVQKEIAGTKVGRLSRTGARERQVIKLDAPIGRGDLRTGRPFPGRF